MPCFYKFWDMFFYEDKTTKSLQAGDFFLPKLWIEITKLDMKLAVAIEITSNWFGCQILFFLQLWTDYIHLCHRISNLLASTKMSIRGCAKKKNIKNSCTNNIGMLEMHLQVQIFFFIPTKKTICSV